MAAPTLTAASNLIVGSGVTSVADPTGITPASGDAILVSVDVNGTARTITVTDDQGNTYSEIKNQDNGTVEVAVFRAYGAVNALTKITVAISGAATAIGFAASAWTAPNTNDTSGGANNSATPNFLAASPGISSSTDWAGMAVYRHNGSALAVSVDPSGWTRIGSGNAVRFHYYNASATALSSDTVQLTFGANRTGPGAVATIKTVTGGGSTQPPRTMHQFRQRA